MQAKATLPKMMDTSTYGLVQASLMLVRYEARAGLKELPDPVAQQDYKDQPVHQV